MLFESILIFILLGMGVFFIGIPVYKLFKTAIPEKRDSLKEAQKRLEQARLEAEAARLNKESEKIYSQMYDEALQDEEANEENNNVNRRKL